MSASITIASAPSTPSRLSQLLAGWREYCQQNSVMHDRSRGYFKSLNHSMMIPSMILSSVSGIGTIGVGSNEGSRWAVVSLGIVGLLSTCLVSIHRFMNIAELQREHDLYSDMFKNLMNEIDMQLVLDEGGQEMSKMFTNKFEFAKYCKNRLDVLIDKAPAIPQRVANTFDARVKLEHLIEEAPRHRTPRKAAAAALLVRPERDMRNEPASKTFM